MAPTRHGRAVDEVSSNWQKRWFELEDGVFRQRRGAGEDQQDEADRVLEAGLSIQFVSRITSFPHQSERLHVLCLSYIKPGRKTASQVLLGATSQDDVNDWLLAFHRSLASLLEESIAAPSAALLSASIDDELGGQEIDWGLGFGHGDYKSALRSRRCGRVEERPPLLQSRAPRDATPPVPVPRKKVESLPNPAKFSAFSLGDEGLGPKLSLQFGQNPEAELSSQETDRPAARPTDPLASGGGWQMAEAQLDAAQGLDAGAAPMATPSPGGSLANLAPLPKPSAEPIKPTGKYIPPARRRLMKAEAERLRRKDGKDGKDGQDGEDDSSDMMHTEDEGMFDMEMQGGGMDEALEDAAKNAWTHGYDWQWLSGSTSLIGPRVENQDTLVELERLCVDSGRWQRFRGTEGYLGDTERFVGLWAIFDGHRGRRCAEFLRDELSHHLKEAFRSEGLLPSEHDAGEQPLPTGASAERALKQALISVEEAYANAQTLDESGSTAIVALMAGGHLVIGLMGDSGAILSRGQLAHKLTEAHTPGRPDERARIEACGGWVTTETDLFFGQLRRMDLRDPTIRDKASQKCRVVTIYRVCGQLAVSRAIGDADFKNFTLDTPVPEPEVWQFPDGHPQRFDGSLVSSEAEVEVHFLQQDDHFVLIACDGFWDVVSPGECVSFVWARLQQEGITSHNVTNVTKQLADRIAGDLADLALRSGSSDNVTVVIIFLDPLRN
mmetsp:Transcript_12910/g.47810  ORF Transcript_12910/g.47810 Transcript_12910/m.47810 type:complete len:724 (-) Transcript_12910:267-2438(-)